MPEEKVSLFESIGQVFGFASKKKPEPVLPSIVSKKDEYDGAIEIASASSAVYGHYLNIDGKIGNDVETVSKYRDLALQPEIDFAIADIVNETIIIDNFEDPVELNLDDVEYSDKIKNSILEEFKVIVRMLNFNNKGHDIFRQWYVDGRLYYHTIIDEKNPKKGIQEVRNIDPRKIKKVREIKKEKSPTGVDIITGTEEYFVYSAGGFETFNKSGTGPTIQSIRLSTEIVTYVTSGVLDSNNVMVLSHLHKAIKPMNQLRMLEDAVVIYRLARAPERRIFYVDVGNLPKAKAEEYLASIMNKYKNKLVYDMETGEVRDDKRHMSMLEDYWIPRREGGKGTEITTLQGGCLSMDTKVSLLDGRELSIKEIEYEINEGETLWTYSCDEKTGKIKPGLISWAGVTQESAKVMRLTLDNGETITCTPDHKFPVYDKGFVRADELSIDESMIPLYRKKEFLSDYKKLDYEQFFDNESKKWVFTHRMVGKDLRHKEVFDFVYEDYKNETVVIHHKNKNRYNNRPENLCWMGFHDHRKLHQDFGFPPMMGTIAAATKWKWIKENDPIEFDRRKQISSKNSIEYWNTLSEEDYIIQCNKIRHNVQQYIDNQTPKERESRAEISIKNISTGNDRLIELLKDSEYNDNYCKIHSDAWTNEMKKGVAERNIRLYSNTVWKENMTQSHKRVSENQTIIIDNKILCAIIDLVKGKTTHQFTIEDVVNSLNNDVQIVNHFLGLNKSKVVPNWKPTNKFTIENVRKSVTRHGYSSWKDFRMKESIHNHRIVKIEYLSDEIEVGTLTIDADELYHNHHTFALSAGIFTKNSSLGQLDDVDYFKKKLMKALNVPYSRLDDSNQWTLGRATEITRDEVRFNRFIERLRNKFNDLFDQLLEKQLILKGIVSQEDWLKIKADIKYAYSKDSYFSEMKEIEVMKERFNLLQILDPYTTTAVAGEAKRPYISQEWAARHILQQTEEDMKDIKKEIENELAEIEKNAPEEPAPGDAGAEAPLPENPSDSAETAQPARVELTVKQDQQK